MEVVGIKNVKFYRLFVFGILILSACTPKKNPPLFQLQQNSGIQFQNTLADNDSINILNYRNFYNGGGVAIGDLNNDGLEDVFFTANQGSNKLFLNKGNLKFEDASARAGFTNKPQYSTGVVLVDINHDGWLDIYVCNAGSMGNSNLRKNQLFINDHQMHFADSAAAYGLDSDGYSTHASFFDYDRDADLDCFIIDNSPVAVNSLGYPKQRDLPAKNWKVEEHYKGGGDHLYRNDNGRFTEITEAAGIHGTLMSFGLGITITDVNRDGWPDIYVSNDFFERDYLYINKQNGTFADELESRMSHNSFASMGADAGDINNDGYADIFTTDMLPADDYRLKTTLSFDDIDQFRLKERNGFFNQYLQNTLQLNDGHGKFKDVANYSGVQASEWSWGALMFDADNDGLNDLYVCNGIYRDLTNQDFLSFDANEIKARMLQTGQKNLQELVNKIPSIAVPNKMFHNKGNLKFEDAGEVWGFTENSFSNGAAYADLDKDGDLDIIVNNVNEPAFLFKNTSSQTSSNSYVQFVLQGTANNPFAVGSRVEVYCKNKMYWRELYPSRGFQSSVSYVLNIGLGTNTKIDSVKVLWPDGKYSLHQINKTNARHILRYADARTADYFLPVSKNYDSAFALTNTIFPRIEDDDYTDFYFERGIPQMLSHQGPVAAVGDVNQDGLQDIFFGGTLKSRMSLWLQKTDGRFESRPIPAILAISGFVDASLVLFDCDGDNDKDLFVAAGGNAVAPYSRELQHRLFINDGKGNFSLQAVPFPPNKDNIGVALAFDFDRDGDQDIYTGALCVTGSYGTTPESHVYVNDGRGNFTVLQKNMYGGLEAAGMITSATVADVDADGIDELIVAGLWMHPAVFKFTAKKGFHEMSTSLKNLNGWWQHITVADANADGLQDIFLGNLGENFSLHPSPQNPVSLYLNDFDQNGFVDKIITRKYDNKDVPVFMKVEMEGQMPMMKKQNLRNEQYAQQAIQDLFPKQLLDKATLKTVSTSTSYVAYNLGKGNFKLQPLPMQAQLSSIKTISFLNANADQLPDIVIGGNEFGFQPQLGRLDASTGELLINQKDHFTMATAPAGLQLNGQVRYAEVIDITAQPHFLVLHNDREPMLYHFNSNYFK